MKPPKIEQADASKSPWFSTRAGGYHQWLKRQTAKTRRHYARQVLRMGEEPENIDKKYRGYET